MIIDQSPNRAIRTFCKHMSSSITHDNLARFGLKDEQNPLWSGGVGCFVDNRLKDGARGDMLVKKEDQE